MNTEKPICPIQFRDYITYGGNQTFLEVTDQEIPGIVPHTYYCDIYGNIYILVIEIRSRITGYLIADMKGMNSDYRMEKDIVLEFIE